jgi:hypothetical protein
MDRNMTKYDILQHKTTDFLFVFYAILSKRRNKLQWLVTENLDKMAICPMFKSLYTASHTRNGFGICTGGIYTTQHWHTHILL